MNHKVRKLLAVSALAVAGVLAGCSASSSSSTTAAQVQAALKANPALHQKLSADEQQGITHMESCLPNGKAVIGSVMAGTATVETAFQAYQAFQGSNVPGTINTCFPGAHGHPLATFDKCFSPKVKTAIGTGISAATKPYLAHPVKDRHVIAATTTVATSQAALRVAAVCFSKISK